MPLYGDCFKEKEKEAKNFFLISNFNLQSYSNVPSHISDAMASNKNENALTTNDEPRFKRPMYKGVRPYTTVGIFKETCQSPVNQSDVKKSKSNQSERAKTAHLATNQYHRGEGEPLVTFEKTEYQRSSYLYFCRSFTANSAVKEKDS